MASSVENIILHIGQPKTGSTAIQNFLALNRDRLRDGGFHYPKSCQGNRPNHQELMTYLSDGERGQPGTLQHWKNGEADKMKAWAAAEARAIHDFDGVHTVTFSSEAMVRMTTTDLDRFCNEFLPKGCALTALAYFRSPLGGLASRLQESAHNGPLMRPPQVNGGSANMRRYRDYLGDRFILRKYDRATLKNGSIIDDSCEVFGIDPAGLQPLGKEANLSHSAESAVICQYLRHRDVTPQTQRDKAVFRRNWIKEMDRSIPGWRRASIPMEILQEVNKLLKDSLVVRDEFGLEFKDINYDIIGAPTDLDLETLRYSWVAFDVDRPRLRQLAEAIKEVDGLSRDIRDALDDMLVAHG